MSDNFDIRICVICQITMPDESIDYSDIPPLTEEFWQNATRHLLGISGGKDNAALAVCMCDRVPEILFGSEQTAFQFYV